jgi:hypothetical protein
MTQKTTQLKRCRIEKCVTTKPGGLSFFCQTFKTCFNATTPVLTSKVKGHDCAYMMTNDTYTFQHRDFNILMKLTYQESKWRATVMLNSASSFCTAELLNSLLTPTLQKELLSDTAVNSILSHSLCPLPPSSSLHTCARTMALCFSCSALSTTNLARSASCCATCLASMEACVCVCAHVRVCDAKETTGSPW